MSPITHLLIGWAVANSAPSLSKRERAMVTWASVVPDLDGLGIVAERLTQNSRHPLTWWSDYHHVLGHNLGFAIVVATLAAIIAKQRTKVTLLVLFSFHLHLLGDLIGARGPDGDQWPIPYLLPFSKQAELTWTGQWALNTWPNVVVTTLLIAIAVLLARRRGYSPLELFSAKADVAVVGALRARFPVSAIK